MGNSFVRLFAKLLVLGLGLGAVSNSALAQSSSCSWIQSSIASGYCTGTCVENYQTMHPECFGSSANSAVAVQQITSTSLQQVLAISNAVSARFSVAAPSGATADSGQRIGMAAGNTGSKWNVWASVNEDKNKYDRGNFVNAAIDGANVHNNKANMDVTNVVLGADYMLSSSLVAGVSAAFDHGDGSTESFKNGVSNGVVNSTTKGYTVAPYLAWNINQDWSLDAMAGFGNGEVSSANLKGDNDRVFYGLNLNYSKWYGNWQVTGKGGYFYGEEKYENLKYSGTVMNATASKSKLDQLRVGLQAGYWMDGVMPYFGLAYSADQKHSTAAAASIQSATEIGKDAWLWSLGVNFFSLKSGITGGVAYNQESGRDHAKHDAVLANISLRF